MFYSGENIMYIQHITNNITKFYNAEEAWRYAVNLIEQTGIDVVTENNQLTREVMNLKLTILHPEDGWPIHGSGWDMNGLNRYAEQFFDSEMRGFDYTYGNRLHAYICPHESGGCYTIDQIDKIIQRLKIHPSTRRAVAVTWYPSDLRRMSNDLHVPCLILVEYILREGKLHQTAVFRSHDILRAYPSNVYALYRLQEHVGKEIGADLGTLTTFSISAHIYR